MRKIFLPPLLAILFFNFSGKAIGQSAAPPITDTLAFYRQQIDSLDKQVIALLGERMRVVEQVGVYKARINMPVLQQARFDAILQKNIALGNAVGLSETFITELMEAIHKESLSKEHAVKP